MRVTFYIYLVMSGPIFLREIFVLYVLSELWKVCPKYGDNGGSVRLVEIT